MLKTCLVASEICLENGVFSRRRLHTFFAMLFDSQNLVIVFAIKLAC